MNVIECGVYDWIWWTSGNRISTSLCSWAHSGMNRVDGLSVVDEVVCCDRYLRRNDLNMHRQLR